MTKDYYNIELLRIHELRDLARKMGVKSPTRLKREELIENINKIINGDAKPYIRPNLKGRPVKNANSFVENDYFVPDLNNCGQKNELTPYPRYESNFDCCVAMPHSTFGTGEDELQQCQGIIDTIGKNYGLIRNKDLVSRSTDVYVSPIIVKKYNLKSGQNISGKCKWLSEEKPKVIVDIDEVPAKTKYEYDCPGESLSNPRKNAFLHSYMLGGKYLIEMHETNRIKDYFENVCNAFKESDTTVYGLKLNAEPYNAQNNVEHMLYVPFNTSDDQVGNITRLFFNVLKRRAEQGQNVIVVVDSLSKFAKAVNNMINNDVMHSTITPKVLYSVKEILAVAKRIASDSSITLIDIEGNITPNTMKEMFENEIKPLYN